MQLFSTTNPSSCPGAMSSDTRAECVNSPEDLSDNRSCSNFVLSDPPNLCLTLGSCNNLFLCLTHCSESSDEHDPINLKETFVLQVYDQVFSIGRTPIEITVTPLVFNWFKRQASSNVPCVWSRGIHLHAIDFFPEEQTSAVFRPCKAVIRSAMACIISSNHANRC